MYVREFHPTQRKKNKAIGNIRFSVPTSNKINDDAHVYVGDGAQAAYADENAHESNWSAPENPGQIENLQVARLQRCYAQSP